MNENTTNGVFEDRKTYAGCSPLQNKKSYFNTTIFMAVNSKKSEFSKYFRRALLSLNSLFVKWLTNILFFRTFSEKYTRKEITTALRIINYASDCYDEVVEGIRNYVYAVHGKRIFVSIHETILCTKQTLQLEIYNPVKQLLLLVSEVFEKTNIFYDF